MGRNGMAFARRSFLASIPASSTIFRSALPAAPTKGLPCSASSAPGASPTKYSRGRFRGDTTVIEMFAGGAWLGHRFLHSPSQNITMPM
jgi:hypothetical protein